MDGPAPLNIDGITPVTAGKPQAKNVPPKDPKAAVLSRAKFALITLVGLPYILFILWSFFLLSVLPDASGRWDMLVPFANLLSMVFGMALFLAGLFAVLRIGKAGSASDNVRYMGFARAGIFIVPGLLLAGFVPYWISREPPLSLVVTSPPAGTELIAPVSVSFSAAEASEILKRKGLTTKSYVWDFNADEKTDEETVTPEATAYFDRQGGYTVIVNLNLSNGSTRVIRSRVVIPKAVFSYAPFFPVVDEPVKFSVAHLIPEAKEIEVRNVQWDFNDDGIPDETSMSLETTHTFLRTGDQRVTVVISYTNQTQNTYFRTLTINKPLPNPFPVSIETTPEFLENPVPFPVVFQLITDADVQEVKWDFDDGSPEEIGRRVGHTFRSKKIFQVKATVKNTQGEIAKASTIVKVVENLEIPDLFFDGTHQVVNARIDADAPVAISLTPKTTMSLIDFWWEADKATQVTSTDTMLKAVYRDEGTYNLVLLAKDAEGRVMRRPIVLNVRPRSTSVDFEVRPTQPVAPETVTFDASASFIEGDQITGFVWNFGEGKQDAQRFGDAREEYEYTKPGTYVVTLTVNTLSGRSEVKTRTVTVRAPELKACFTPSRRKVAVFKGILFDWSCSTGRPSSIVWKFGDRAEATSDPDDPDKKIDHIYEKPGNFTVELILRDTNDAVSTYTQQITVE